MVKYNCDNCDEEFTKKSLYNTHIKNCNNNENIDNIIKEVLELYTIKELSEKLDLATGTIKRWIELKNVPKSYQFDLLKLLSKDIDYSKYSSKEKDQFFTPIETAQYCFDILNKKLEELNISEKEYSYIEPSAGDGSFMKVLPKDRTIGMDIEPKDTNIIKQDYLSWTSPINDKSSTTAKYIVFGNPPFGLRGHLALRFINHSNKFADFIGFILPQLFESDGKGVPRKRVKGFNLIHTEKLVTDFYEPDKKNIKVNVIFQIWSKYHTNDDYIIKEPKKDLLRVYSLSDGGSSSSTRNKDMLNKCDIYLPSTCFGKENMKYYNSFNELPGRKGYGIVFHKNKTEMKEKCKNIDWSNISFLSTNSSYNLRTSTIITQFE
jgi:hypothetical protein